MKSGIFTIVFLLLPLLYLTVYSLKQARSRQLATTGNGWIILLLLAFTACTAYYPEELSSDKFRYVRGYFSAINGGWEEFRDYGWVVYNRVCGKLFGLNIDFFFLLTASAYVFSYYYWARKTFDKRYIGYFIVMAVGCLGFTNYGTNVIRAGLAISLLIFAANIKGKWVYKAILALLALSLHKSMIIPIAAYIAAKYVKSVKVMAAFWLLCLLLSAINFDLGPFFEAVGFIDERVDSYVGSMEEAGSGAYEQGFRVDFLIYSLFPVAIAAYYILYGKMADAKYGFALRMYLLCNAIWLLVIRMAYTDRIAYFSWFLIPFLSLYPAIVYQKSFKHPQRLVLMFMSIFMFVRLLLSLRSVI